MYAQIVVDVPTQQTNHSFDYLIPSDLTPVIQPGMRVAVPFGRSQRLVQGFVVGISATSKFSGKLKPIDHLIDLRPVLNAELLQLSYWLAQQTFSFWISCMQTMLPSVMRAKYQKAVIALDKNLQKQDLFQGQIMKILDNQLSTQMQKQLSLWQKNGLVEIKYLVKNQAKQLEQWFIQRQSYDYSTLLSQIKPQAKKQRQLLQLFIDNPKLKSISLKELLNKYHFTAATINAIVKKGWLAKNKQVVWRQPASQPVEATTDLKLTLLQQAAYQKITQAKDQVVLLEGVTGSGKTEVYLQSIKYFLQKNKTALMLVPEIALTPQMVAQVQGRFGKLVAVLHSGLSAGERYDEWRRIETGQATVVVGARSAVFAPLKNLGIIIIDEEHEASYKQEDNPRYHARDVALWRGQYHHCPVILGSATPSLESRARGQKKVYQLVKLSQRVNQHPLPQVDIVDLRNQDNLTAQPDLSKPLVSALQQCLKQQEQAILLLNRRGFASYLMCRECGYVPQCPHCDISLTVHLQEHYLMCHYCGYKEPIMKICPHCSSAKLRFSGTGTQKVEQQLQAILPTARIIRMDNDTTSRKNAHSQLLKQFETAGDILLGTQMIAKGLDFPNVTLVGVINADTGLITNDFRASERTFQLLTQVSGRAGRAQKEGRVYIQTYNPQHYAIQLAARQDYEHFYQQEMRFRHQAGYPPYFYLIKVTISHRSQAQAFKMAYNIAKQIKPVLTSSEQLLGPTQPTVARVKNRYYYQ
ncbi:primosomal protein N', partial [Bombilactobacillus bombi]|uniref:primosomal protein N' n=1 Tax=Bombilactobacillus bombi TaxID=1303590 RepID=UPI0015E5F681